MSNRFIGVDLGAETIKIAVLRADALRVSIADCLSASHRKDPHGILGSMLSEVGLSDVAGIASTGRLHRIVRSDFVPTKAAIRRGFRLLCGELQSATVVSVGANGFSVLELHPSGDDYFAENSRCSQGTGNFLTQLTNRFGMSVQEASELCDTVANPAALSGRCPVILKTDMTHLANKGEDRGRILAGLFDAVSENIVALVRPRLAPRNVILIGGVTRSSRIRRTIERWLIDKGMRLVDHQPEHDFIEALGAACHAVDHPGKVIQLPYLLDSVKATKLERIPALRNSLERVCRYPKTIAPQKSENRSVYIGLDIGSTGSKAVAIDESSGESVWEHYTNTQGAPIDAAKRLVKEWTDGAQSGSMVRGIGVTGSGREIVGSLLRSCFDRDRVFVMNEIAAHAEGALSIDKDVDTIFEIGGQDAKYIRLEGGRVVDAAMNEACSAGTGSFIAEQGVKFDGVGDDVAFLALLAENAKSGVSLGQHCSVFMAEVIDEAISQGVDREAIIVGLFDSVVQNYLNRVKGTRTIGRRIFCQGMPFSSPVLAAAVARQTGRRVVVPPNPGTIGALGIALLARKEAASCLSTANGTLDLSNFLDAKVLSKEAFLCKNTKGCGGNGNHCRIDRLTTLVGGTQQRFLWGGNCSLYDRGTARAKLPDLAPDPFVERESLVTAILDSCGVPRKRVSADGADVGENVVAMTDEFALKGMLPLFATFVHNLGFRCHVLRNANHKILRKGIEGARVPYCAPMQMYHGALFELSESKAQYILMPMLKELPPVETEPYSTLCPVVQASPDIIGSIIEHDSSKQQQLRPSVSFGRKGYDSDEFSMSMQALARQLGRLPRFATAFAKAVKAQRQFEEDCFSIGRRALGFAKANDVVPIAVLGRPYTIYNDVLNSNVPSILRALGALAIPVDCIPVPDEIPCLRDQYWGYTQRNLRAATFVRDTNGLYSVFCSNYACGPDSFTLHFYSYLMQGKPSAIVETDGHSGDAGTRTRMEAFLHCVDTDVRSQTSAHNTVFSIKALEDQKAATGLMKAEHSTLLVPRMGTSAEVVAACMRSEGFRCESLPMPTREDVRIGRRYTSGKECLPMMLTTGSLLKRLERDRHTTDRFSFLMPTAHGPCRFGVYNVLHKIILEQTGWADRVDVFSPDDGNYFRETSPELAVKVWCGFAAHDMLEAMLLDVRPVETRKGAANNIYRKYKDEILACAERPSKGTAASAAMEVFGKMWGMRDTIERAAHDFALIKDRLKDVPSVAVVGEIYVRLDPFANDYVIDKLEERGIRARFAPFIEWLEYTQHLSELRVIDRQLRNDDNPLSIGLSGLIERASLELLFSICAKALGWGKRTTVAESTSAAAPYLNPELTGEACLTIGGPIHEFKEKLVQGVVIVGPHECMPCRIAEAQYGKVADHLRLPYIAVSLNGDPMNVETLDRFAYDIHEAHRQGYASSALFRSTKNGTKLLGPKKLDSKLTQLRLSAKDGVYGESFAQRFTSPTL